jgi:hypothetical protein
MGAYGNEQWWVGWSGMKVEWVGGIGNVYLKQCSERVMAGCGCRSLARRRAYFFTLPL